MRRPAARWPRCVLTPRLAPAIQPPRHGRPGRREPERLPTDILTEAARIPLMIGPLCGTRQRDADPILRAQAP